MTPPPDGHGWLVFTAAAVFLVTVLVFAFWVLGGWKRFIPVARLTRMRQVVVPTLYLALAVGVGFGLLAGALWLEGRQNDAAWNRYEQWYDQQHPDALPSVGAAG